MPRRPRDKGAGSFHVWVHCVWASRTLFRDDTDRMVFLRKLADTTALSGWTCIGFCLMRSHYHLVVNVGDGVLPAAMFKLNLGYARDHNRRYGLRGHVQYDRYGARRLDDCDRLKEAYKYVMRNPCAAGICESPADWPWSSYRGTVGLATPHTFIDDSLILACFEGSREAAVARLRAFVEEP